MKNERIPLAIELGVNVLEVVKDVFGIEGDVNHDEYRHTCLFHMDRNPSCDVNLRTGDFNCLSCKAKGDLATLGAQALGKPRNEIIELLSPRSASGRLEAVQRRVSHLRSREASERNVGPLEENLHDPSEYEKGPLTYLRDRGFTKRTCETYGVRYVRRTKLIRIENEEVKAFEITHSIAIPVRNASGKLEAWCYRATEASQKWQPRYLYTPEMRLADGWFGIDLAKTERSIVVVEGALDAMWLHQNGYPAVAILGSGISPRKAAALRSFRKVTMFPDYDPAGFDWILRLGSLLHGYTGTTVCLYPRFLIKKMERDQKKKLDPQDLPPSVLHKMIKRAVPFQWWKHTIERRQHGGVEI
jgi:DNA primase